MKRENTRTFILTHCARYPALRPADLIKALHQSTFGCGHLVGDPSAAAEFIRREGAACKRGSGPAVEALDGEFVRLHLWGMEELGITAEELAEAFAASAAIPCGSREEIEGRLSVLLELAEGGALPFGYGETARAVEQWRQAGYPAQHHSEQFRAAYAPAYRVLWRRHAEELSGEKRNGHV